MTEIKTAALIALAHGSKLAVNLFIMKQIALSFGPEGLGFLGNFISLIALTTTFAGGGIISGIIKYTAEYAADRKKQTAFLGSALLYSLSFSILVLLMGIFFITPLTQSIFLSAEYKIFIYFFLLLQIAVAFNNWLIGLCNGFRKTKIYTGFTVSGNLLALAVAAYVLPQYGYWGAVIAIATPSFASLLPALIYTLAQRKPIKIYLLMTNLKAHSIALGKYSLMLGCSALCFPVVEMLVRNLIVHTIDLTAAGYWQAITRLSSAYLSFYSLFLSFYFVPLISATQEKLAIRTHVRRMIFFICVLFIPVLLLFFLCRQQVITLVFSTSFTPIADLFMVQLFGDLFRVLGWIIGFIIVAKACTKLYIFSEMMQAVLFIGLSSWQLSINPSLQSVVFAYAATCMLYCLASFIIFYYLFRPEKTELIRMECL